MKTKIKCYSFAFDEKTDGYLRKIAKELDMKMATIVARGIEMFGEKKGVEK